MGTLLNRRRVMGGSTLNTPYIKDGLIFLLDGIDKGASDGTWVDLVGGNVFTIREGDLVTSLSDGFEFDGGVMLGTKSLNVSEDCTVEFVIEPSSLSGIVFQGVPGPANGGIMVLLQSGLFRGRKQAYTFVMANKCTFSIHENFGYENMTELAKKSGTDFWNSLHKGAVVGAETGASGLRYPFKGIIHCIRVYNRNLTADEMLFNQQIDNVRFNLGL